LLKVAEKAARDAGALLMENFRKIYTIERKADQSLVTDIDKRSEKLIIDRIVSAWPSHTIIGEESGKTDTNGEYCWVIDPIDGTHNYIRGMKNFGVSIGILRRKEFVAGVIYLPCDDILYCAEKGAGAFINGLPLKVSNVDNPAECTLLFDSGFKTGYNEKIDVFKKVAPQMFNVRIFGASVRNLTYVADGVADVLLEFDDNLWDYAAGITIVTEAGGKVTDLDGKELTPESRNYIASNKAVHESMLQMVNACRK